ncbi:peptidoglycan/xylan/chitin deacetylase (PgdA/CDA1 family) [Paenibacillus shirakamiensis]|uniref:Peptidoglycan/xylan/chitin deacetylase (PgdA/CDA1 family) n=1 Tax=Paenibacillus shirakamiensis TaxID=1265935 RepID=A0ABS4JFL0_9BACL|nr:polysaccharide deacetylase family protein [Paenibacillus shirakamiensis]MBP1999855.1 peptidoglycan/xylan/chitin deacetylase (PgdA/CDA1 family) [Paenibacillus shirakamiensis]
MNRSQKTRTVKSQKAKHKRRWMILMINGVLLTALAGTTYFAYTYNQGHSTTDLPKWVASKPSKDVPVKPDLHKPDAGADNSSEEIGNKPKPPVEPTQPKPTVPSQPVQGQVPSVKPQPDQADPKIKTVYLTFDDGPSKYTDQILDILDKAEVHGTFFMIGTMLQEEKPSIERLLKEGHFLGMHSMSHNYRKLYKSGSSANFIQEFKQEQQLLQQITGVKTSLIRPPYGSAPQIGYDFRTAIANAGFKMWDWTVDSKDWSYTGRPDKVVQQVKRQVHRKQEVILMHEKSQTVKALPEIIAYLKSQGYSFAVYKPDHHIVMNFGKDSRL